MFMILAFSFRAEGARLMTRMAKVHLENLNIGQSYTSEDIGGLSLEIFNDSDEVFPAKVETVIPLEAELESGYEPIPDINWIQFPEDEFEIKVQGWVKIPFILTIPEKEEYLGKKFQAYVFTHTAEADKGKIGIGLGLKTKILFTIKETVSEEKEKKVLKGNINFLTDPEVINFSSFKRGRIYRSEDSLEGNLIVKNQADQKLSYKVESIDVSTSLLNLEKAEYEAAPDPSFVSLTEPEFDLHPGEEKEVSFSIEIPKEKEYKNKKYMFILKVSQEDAGKYVRILIDSVK